jgi:hypothetical protein
LTKVDLPAPDRPIDPNTLEVLMAAAKTHPHADTLATWVREGLDAGHPWNPRSTPTVTNYERARAALACALSDDKVIAFAPRQKDGS